MKIKKIAIGFIIAVIFINLALVGGYFKYYVSPQITEETIKVQKKVKRNMDELIDCLNEYHTVEEAVSNYQEDHVSGIYIENSDGEVIYNNSDIWDNKLNYYISKIVTIDNSTYLIKLFENRNWDNLSSVSNFIYFEIFVVFIIIIIMFIGTRSRILKPLEKIQTSIKNYKFGIKPARIIPKDEFDLIENSFVDLVDSLENEKENQRRIITSISHDIKTPVTSILGYSDRLIQSNLDENTKEKYINIIYQKALSLKEISDEFENYLYENNHSTVKIEKIQLCDLQKLLEIDYKVDLSDKNIDLKINFKNNKDFIDIDLAKIKRVFSNVISNSVRYLNQGGRIEISCKKIEGYYQFEVSDNGSGTKEDDLNKLFEPLFTTDKSRKISGLGLSICKEIIEMHQGSILAYNNNYGGLTIEFTIKRESKNNNKKK